MHRAGAEDQRRPETQVVIQKNIVFKELMWEFRKSNLVLWFYSYTDWLFPSAGHFTDLKTHRLRHLKPRPLLHLQSTVQVSCKNILTFSRSSAFEFICGGIVLSGKNTNLYICRWSGRGKNQIFSNGVVHLLYWWFNQIMFWFHADPCCRRAPIVSHVTLPLSDSFLSLSSDKQKDTLSNSFLKWLYDRFGVYIEDFRFQPEEQTVETEEPLSAKRWEIQKTVCAETI